MLYSLQKDMSDPMWETEDRRPELSEIGSWETEDWPTAGYLSFRKGNIPFFFWSIALNIPAPLCTMKKQAPPKKIGALIGNAPQFKILSIKQLA